MDANTVHAALSGKLIEEEKVETRPECVPAACIDENVCLKSVKKYFTLDGWAAVNNVVDVIKRHPVWYCGQCSLPISDETEDSVVCDSCLVWHHFKCLGLQNSPRVSVWFCRSCYSNK